MCADQTLCWQSVGPLFLYVLSLRLGADKAGGVELTLTVAYDPPGFLPDLAESLGRSRRFKHELEADLREYVHCLQSTGYRNWRSNPPGTSACPPATGGRAGKFTGGRIVVERL